MKINIFWFRRDLRIEDNSGLWNSLEKGSVLPIFIFDEVILKKLPKDDARIGFIYDQLSLLKEEFQKYGADLKIYYGKPVDIFANLLNEYDVEGIYTNNDYEPYALKRDSTIRELIEDFGGAFYSYKDQVIFEKNEIVKKDGLPYTVFTPYSRKWKEQFTPFEVAPYASKAAIKNGIIKIEPEPMLTLDKIGFKPKKQFIPSKDVSLDILKNYHETRNIPGVDGTSRMSLHLRFGTISIRHLVKIAHENNEAYLNELIWREFLMQILYNFPHVVNQSFKTKYDNIRWLNDKDDFELWKQGLTGYPMVDAGMRELNQTGHMHNRVRMVVASFLCKHLLIHWSWGEKYFAEKLLDYDLAANNGGWQWSAGTGCDAAPYFRVFNPTSQQERFDPDFVYIKRWLPEYDTDKYPAPMIDHKEARIRALMTYKQGLGKN